MRTIVIFFTCSTVLRFLFSCIITSNFSTFILYSLILLCTKFEMILFARFATGYSKSQYIKKTSLIKTNEILWTALWSSVWAHNHISICMTIHLKFSIICLLQILSDENHENRLETKISDPGHRHWRTAPDVLVTMPHHTHSLNYLQMNTTVIKNYSRT